MKAFEIDPVTKPDMSNYLIHMTDEQSFNSILKSGGSNSKGLIKALIPKGANKDSFSHEIACFTETPIHAIGAFLEISKRRSNEKMVYGIGFKKTLMVELGVRPTLYLDGTKLANFFELKKIESLDEKTRSFLDSLSPLIHPLGENAKRQGFTWEREWRYTDKHGFSFSYEEIEVICCPKESQELIKLELGEYAKDIKFVDTSSKYQEITQFISYSNERALIEEGLCNSDNQEELDEFLDSFDLYVEQLTLHKEYLVQLQTQLIAVEEELGNLKEWREDIKAHTGEYCGHYSKKLRNIQMFGTMCPDCADGLNYTWNRYYKDA
ncbi:MULTISPECIES: hypothetical protein [Pseudoalteromonas]|uniref:Uncharacterized protein n=1 Tax=Pseudoalteromonas fuliginea TaxID=1872678 RepID=A0ABQ6REZ1_9GAMM|nr:hypothetical protein [Pseudoalteromonas fuliginea]KAA1152091.1 hypothetical protein EU509_14945 [Pseudoalteromonas fuliginea]KAA1166188.1 hypothetical protein EUZ79_14935 [Pseudoalteromonas fuliginea]